jgi:hypothetical protein
MTTRTTDPTTSHNAGKSVTGLAETYRLILSALDKGGQNDEGLIKLWRQNEGWKLVSDSGIRSRRSELTAQGIVQDSGKRIKMASGRMSIVWERA